MYLYDGCISHTLNLINSNGEQIDRVKQVKNKNKTKRVKHFSKKLHSTVNKIRGPLFHIYCLHIYFNRFENIQPKKIPTRIYLSDTVHKIVSKSM